MYCITKPLSSEQWPHPMTCPEGLSPEQLLFIDIETTGLSYKTSFVYLIGCVYYKNNIWQLTQWYIDHSNEEFLLLETVFAFVSHYTHLLHFNGRTFDLPYLKNKAQAYLIDCPLADSPLQATDLYRTAIALSPLLQSASQLPLTSMKQSALEPVVRFIRRDRHTGKELIPLYKGWQKTKSTPLLEKILLHNEDDLLGMCRLTELLALSAIVKGAYNYEHADGDTQQFTLHSHCHCNTVFSFVHENSFGTLSFEHNSFHLTIPLNEHCFKLFYANPNDYLYLPKEDTIVLKQLAKNVPPEHAIPATKETCYQKIPAKAPEMIQAKMGMQILKHYFETL